MFIKLRTWGLLCAAVLFAVLILAAPKNVLAAGENFTWQGETIAASGGVFSTPQLSPNNVTFTKRGDTYVAEQRYTINQTFFCFVDYTITLTSGNSGSLDYRTRDCPGQPSSHTIPNITINGTPPASAPSAPAPTTGSISGVVRLEDESRSETPNKVLTDYFFLGGVAVGVEGGGYSALGTTNNSGSFSFTQVPPGTYTVSTSGNYNDEPSGNTYPYNFSSEVVVAANQTAIVSFSENVTATPPTVGSPTDPNSCASQTKGLGWLSCPLITTAADAAKNLADFIVNFLKLDTETLFTNSETSSAFRDAWAAFRNISYAILVIIGLIMVASQVFNIEIFSAYTLRKMLPGLIIAVIFVTLSWDLMQFLYELSNDAADAIMEIIRVSFEGVGSVRDSLAGGRAQDSLADAVGGLLGLLGLGTVGAIAVITFIAFGGWGVILSLIASLAIAVFSVFVLLAARNVVAYLLVIIAPIAIMCAAFEPLKKAFSFWRGLLVVIVITVPGVAAIISMTGVAALVSAEVAKSDTASTPERVFSFITAFIILIAGFALVWTLFLQMDKITGFMGNVANKVTGKAQQALAGYRSNTFKRRFGEVKSGERKLGLGLEKAGVGTAVRMASLAGRPGQNLNPFSKKGREGWKGLREAESFMTDEAARKLIERDRGRTTGGDDNMAVAEHAKSIEEYVDHYAERKKQQHLRRNPNAPWTDELQKAAEEEGWTTGRQIQNSMGGDIGSRAVQQAAFIARRTSATAYNDYNLKTAAGVRAMREEMALEDSRAIDAGLFNAVQIAAINKENKARVDINGESYPRMMGHINEAYKRYKARQKSGAGGKTRVRKMDSKTGKPIVDEATGQEVYEDVDLGELELSAGTHGRLLSDDEHKSIARGVSEYTTAAAKMAGRTEGIQVEVQYARERLAETMEESRERIIAAQSYSPKPEEIRVAQAQLSEAQEALARVINDPSVPEDQKIARQGQVRTAQENMGKIQQQATASQTYLDEAQREIVRQLAAISAEQQVMAAYGSPENARTYDEEMLAKEMPGMPGTTVAAYIEQLRQSSNVFAEYERTYRQSLTASVQAEQAQQQATNPANPVGPPPGAPPV